MKTIDQLKAAVSEALSALELAEANCRKASDERRAADLAYVSAKIDLRAALEEAEDVAAERKLERGFSPAAERAARENALLKK